MESVFQNASQNGTGIAYNVLTPWQRYVIGLILILIDSVIFGGNCLVIAAVSTTKRLQNVTNLYVVSLATADLMVAVFVLPFSIYVELTQSWPLGPNLCKLWLTMDILLCTASILNLGCISVDRYLAITRPLIYATQRSKKLATGMICAVWVLSCVITFPPILGWSKHQLTEGVCMISIDPGFRIYSSLGSFFVPFVIMIFVYVNIFVVARRRRALLLPHVYHHHRVIWRRKQQTPSSQLDTTNSNNTATQVESGSDGSFSTGNSNSMEFPPGSPGLKQLILNTGHISTLAQLPGGRRCLPASPRETTARSRDQDQDDKKRERVAFRREHKTAKTLAIVVGSFSACWLPFFTIYLLEPFCGGCFWLQIVFPIVTWLGYSNSVFNPFIYAFYNKEYATAFRRLLRLDRCCKSAEESRNGSAMLSIRPRRY